MSGYLKSPLLKPWVFISYARSDGESFANDLTQRLHQVGVPLWRDRVDMEGGRDWWLQITEALDLVTFMVLVMTPNAMQSESVRKEWRLARQKGVCVYPVMGKPDLDLTILPRWMRQAHFYDLEHEWPKFVNDLNTRPRVARVPFMAGDMPPDFVARRNEFSRLIALLHDPQREEPVAITAALRGAGGYGKTTLATSLCHDERIQEAFDDGVLWVTLGEQPGDLIGRVEDLIEILSGERPGFTGLDAAAARLAELLADREMLIIIDDVWNASDLRPFLNGGPRCARLITTRNLDTLPVNARKVDVDAMSRDEGVELLSSGLPTSCEHEMNQLASRLCEWPLLLRLVNKAMVDRVCQNRQALPEAIAYMNRALDKRGLTAFDARDPKARGQAVAMTLGVSLERLTPGENERFAELAVFPDDVSFPLSTVEKLWARTGGFDSVDTEDLCTRLHSLSLLLELDLGTRCLRLHDIVRKFLISRHGTNLPVIHAQLLDAHTPPTPAPDTPAGQSHSHCWVNLSAREPYLWDHLAYHLLEANRPDELVRTVKDLGYLAQKTLFRSATPAEADLLLAEKAAPNDEALRLLRRVFVQSGHLLNGCEQLRDVQVTFLSRLQPFEELAALSGRLAPNISRPWLAPIGPIPDLPRSALIRTFSGHKGPAYGCALSRDGRLVASVSADFTLKLWDINKSAERMSFPGHKDIVTGCAISSDATFVVSASHDMTLKVWDIRSGSEQITLVGHSGPVFACAISADRTFIVSASDDGTLKVWDRRTGVERLTLSGHRKPVTNCAISQNGDWIVSGSDDETVKVWDARSGTERATLAGHKAAVNGCAISPDGSFLVSAAEDRTLKVWDTARGAVRLTLRGHLDSVLACAISPNSAFIVSGSADCTLRLWDAQTGAQRLQLAGHLSAIYDCACGPGGGFVISASADHTVKVWDTTRQNPDPLPASSTDPVNSCALSPDGAMLLSTSLSENIKVREARTGKEKFTIVGHNAVVTSCAFSPDGTFVVSGSVDRTVRLWDARTFSATLSLPPNRMGDIYPSQLKRVRARGLILIGHDDTVLSCAISHDGQFIASASADATLKVWDAKTGRRLCNLVGHEGPVLDCAFGPGLSLISASADRTLKAWDPRNGALKMTFEGHSSEVIRCAASPDGTYVVSSSSDQTLRIWDCHTGAERMILKGHRARAGGCAINPLGTWILSASDDQSLKLWEAATGTCLVTLHLDGPLTDCAWFPDGERIVAAGRAGLYFLRLMK